MEKESKKVVHVEEVGGVPFIDWSTAKMIVEKDLAFEWKNQFYKLRHGEVRIWAVCRDCRLGDRCTEEVLKMCATFDQHLGGCNRLELA